MGLNQIVRFKDLPLFTGLRRTTILRLMERGEFPKPVPLTNSGRALGWYEDDIAAWQERRRAAARENQDG